MGGKEEAYELQHRLGIAVDIALTNSLMGHFINSFGYPNLKAKLNTHAQGNRASHSASVTLNEANLQYLEKYFLTIKRLRTDKYLIGNDAIIALLGLGNLVELIRQRTSAIYGKISVINRFTHLLNKIHFCNLQNELKVST